MTDELPAQWALDKAAQECGFHNWEHVHYSWKTDLEADALRLAARYIEKHEPAPVDPDLELAREAAAEWNQDNGYRSVSVAITEGERDEHPEVQIALLAIRKLKERGK